MKNHDTLYTFLIIIAILIGLIVDLFIGGLVWWGIGSLIVYAFHINYTWTFLQGLCISLLTFILVPSKLKIRLDDKEDK